MSLQSLGLFQRFRVEVSLNSPVFHKDCFIYPRRRIIKGDRKRVYPFLSLDGKEDGGT